MRREHEGDAIADVADAQPGQQTIELLLTAPLDILDDFGETGDIGTHLDLALCRLENHLGVNTAGIGGAQELRAALERELVTSSARTAELPWELKPI